ncbi:MAG: hypoxanthine phosphoribosyltransferase [Candidatus Eisenbacteria sp.]|nr:hypoxanthine phosphoribosyltransferase [Candidatus Eisenbacteria bacterium]
MSTPQAEQPGKSFRILIPAEQIRVRIQAMGKQITEDYQGKRIVLISVLKGSFIFLADLVRSIALPVDIDFIAASSYPTSSKSTGTVRFVMDAEIDIQGRDVLIVEDVVDTGLTLEMICARLMTRRPASLKVCTLLNKPSRRVAHVPMEYSGFDVEDYFVIGYGLDYAERFRNLPDIGIVDDLEKSLKRNLEKELVRV